jgi:hypothetical protein
MQMQQAQLDIMKLMFNPTSAQVVANQLGASTNSRAVEAQVRGQTRTRSQALLVSPLPPRQTCARLPLAAREYLR